MTDIAVAILCVGLCFYNAYLKKNKLEVDFLAGIIAFIAALIVLF